MTMQNNSLMYRPYGLFWLTLTISPMDSVLLIPLKQDSSIQPSVFRLMLILCLVSYALKAIATRNCLLPGNRVVRYLWFLWFVWMLISFMWAPDPHSGLRRLLQLASCSFVTLISWYYHRRSADRSVLQSILVMSLLFAVLEELTGFRLPAPRKHFFVYELTSFYFNPSHLAASLALILPWTLERFSDSKGLSKFMRVTEIILILYVILRTGTKGNIVAACLVLFVYCLGRLRDPRKVLGFFIVIALVCGVLFLAAKGGIIPEVMVGKIAQLSLIFSEDAWMDVEGSFGSRWHIWHTAIDLSAQRPISGWGIGSLYDFGRSESESGLSIHNFWLELMIEQGVVGTTIFFLILLAVVLKELFARESRSVLLSLVALVPISLTVSSITTLWVFWIILGIAMTKCERSRVRQCYSE